MSETIIACPNCRQQLRLPRHRGNLKVTCPRCKKLFDWPPPNKPTLQDPSHSSDTYQELEQFSQPETPSDEWSRAEVRVFWTISGVLFVLMWAGLEISDVVLLPAVVMALSAGWAAVEFLIHPFVKGHRIREFERILCPHGVPGGLTAGQCSLCGEKQRQLEYKRRADQARAKEHERIREQARDLREKEFHRLADQIRRDYRKLLELSPRAFEDLVSELFRKRGYAVEQTPYSNDRGRDAIALKDGKTYLIECKRYARDRSIGRRDLQVFHSAVTEAAATRGFFVTTAKFGKTAKEFVQGKKITLVDENNLIEVMRRYMPYDSEEADKFRVMCKECGDIVERRLSRSQEIVHCVQRHEVASDLTDKMLIYDT